MRRLAPVLLAPALLALALLAPALPAAAAEPEVIAPDALFPEGPAVHDGALYWAEYGGHRIRRWDGKAVTPVWEREGCGPSAVLPFDGGFLVTCYDSGELAFVSPAGETLRLIASDAAGTPFAGPNDLAADGRGGAWFTASGPWESGPIVGRVFHVGADLAVREVADDLHYANGLTMTADGARLLVAESEAGRIVSFAAGPDGTLSDRRLFARIAALDPDSGPGAYPDGLKLGPDGSIWVGQYSSGRILVLSPDGAALLRVLAVPAAAAPNLALAPDGRSVYVMAVDETAEAPYRGRVLRLPAE